MATNPSNRLYEPGKDIPGVAGTAVTGCRFVSITGNGTKPNPKVGPVTTAGVKPFGVASHDAAVGEVVTIRKIGVVQVYSPAALVAGNEVQTDATGQAVILAAGRPLGTVLFDVAAGALAYIDLY